MSIPRKKNVTAKDIANACGISQATVSYVINNKEGKKISDATRQLVLETARQLNYVPNSTARSMRTNRSMSIGIVSGRNNLSLGFSHVLRGVKEYLDSAGYSITLLNDDSGDIDQHEYVRYYRSSRIDGILFLFYEMEDSTMKMLEEEHIPFFLADESGVWHSAEQHHTLLEDGISQAVELCRQKQLQRIRFFSLQYGEALFSKKWNLFSSALAKGYPEAELKRFIFQTVDIPVPELCDNFYNALCSEEFDVAITPNPRIGWLVQSAILQKQFSIPMPIRHICIAASSMFQLIYPTITSLDMPLEEMGCYAAKQLVRVLSGLAIEEHVFSCFLKEGISTL